MKSMQLEEDNAWLYDSNEFFLSKFGVAHVVASKDRRCTQDMKIRGFALQTEQGRHLKRPSNFNTHPFCTIL